MSSAALLLVLVLGLISVGGQDNGSALRLPVESASPAVSRTRKHVSSGDLASTFGNLVYDPTLTWLEQFNPFASPDSNTHEDDANSADAVHLRGLAGVSAAPRSLSSTSTQRFV